MKRAVYLGIFVALVILGLLALPEEPLVIDLIPGKMQKPYSPAEGRLVEVTPPPFIWVPVKEAREYVLQVSTSKEFPGEATRTFSELRRSVFVPGEPLAPGLWYWRIGIQQKEGTIFGRARSFTVPRQARLFPFPDWDKVLKKVPRVRPRLFFPGPRLQQVRQWAGAELKPFVDAMVASCRREVGKELVVEPGWRPRGKGFGPWSINVMNTTRPSMDLMEQYALVYLLTGDLKLGQEARRRLLHFFSWDPDGPTGFFSYDEPGMWMMMRGTRAYDWTYDLFAPQERAVIETNMKARARHFFQRLQQLPFESNPYNSHAGRLPGFLGECALSFIYEWPEASEWLNYVTLLFYTSYPAWGGDDGGWQEGPQYWNAYIKFALHYVIALREATGVDLLKKSFFRNTPYYALYTATPYHQHRPFGDGQFKKPLDLGQVMYAFSTVTQNPYFRWYARECNISPGSELVTLVTYDPHLTAQSPLELPQGRSFTGVGLASFHTALGDSENDISFLMRSSPYGSVSHGHADQNAYVIEAFGRGLAIATGYYPWYNSPHHHQWTRATRAVNSILVDGQGQVRRCWEANGQLTAFASVDGYDYAEGEAAPAYMGRLQRFRRHVIHVRPGIFVLFDELQAPKPVQFQWLLHAYHRIHIEEANRILRVENTPAAMEVHLLLPAKLKFTQTGKYTPEPESDPVSWTNTWHLTASTIIPSRGTQFLAVLLVYRTGQEDRLPHVEFLPGMGAVGVRLTTPEGNQDIVAFRTERKINIVNCGGIWSAGQVFARGTNKDGRLMRQFTHP